MGEITAKTYTKAKIVGYTGSIASGIILFLFLFFTYIYTPIPPYPEGGGGGGMGVEVNLGYAESGYGDLQQPDISIPDFTNQVAPAPPAESRPQEILSQDIEETANISENPKPAKTQAKVVSNVKPENKIEQKKPQPVVEQPKKVNTSAIYKPKTGTSSAQGNTQGATDQGSLTGKQSSATYGPGGSGGSGAGSGGGTGGGIGEGTGTGIGDGIGPGIRFDLLNRSMIVMQKPEFSIQQEGIVVVEITVDQNGRVIAATPGVKGTTVANKTLWAAAKKAALESKFNVKADAVERQIGTITYHFKLQ